MISNELIYKVTITKDRYLSLITSEDLLKCMLEKFGDTLCDEHQIAYECDECGENIKLCDESDLE